MKKSIENLLEKDLHIVEKRKVIFIIPAVIVFIAAILMIVYNFTLGSALNLGTDFTGGYSIDIQLGNRLNDSNYAVYCNRIENIMSEVTSENGTVYSVRIDNMQRQGSGSKSTIHVKYFSVKGASESEMIDQVNPAVKNELEENILMSIPTLTVDGSKLVLEYSEVVDTATLGDLKTEFASLVKGLNDLGAGITFDGDAEDAVSLDTSSKKRVIIACKTLNATDEVKAAVIEGMRYDDAYLGDVHAGNMVGATVSTELLFNAVLAVVLALIFMLCYIGIRFQLSSGLACILALFHDILMMFAFMAICHIEINNTFIAALITILGYSINNSIIIFDRVRENSASTLCKNMSPEQIANKSIRETMLRSINTTITTLIMIVMIAILGVTDIRIFAFPIIIGLISGAFSSVCIAPSLWALFQRVGKKNDKPNFGSKNKTRETDNNNVPAEARAEAGA